MINKLFVALDVSNHSLTAVDCVSEIAVALKSKRIIPSVVKAHTEAR